jgi:hypothetical protein
MSDQSNVGGGHFEFQACARIDGKPFVMTLIDGEPFGQLSPAEALNHGIRAIQASVEAERDAATVVGLRKAGMDDQAIVAFLVMVREHRGQIDPDPRDDVQPPEVK